MNGQNIIATAWHEAGHVIALRHFNVEVCYAEVTTDVTGLTEPEPNGFQSLTDDNAVVVALSGMYAESRARPNYDINEAITIRLGAQDDMRIIYTRFREAWLIHNAANSTWTQGRHNAAEALLDRRNNEVESIADALLQIHGYPKRLSQNDIERILGS